MDSTTSTGKAAIVDSNPRWGWVAVTTVAGGAIGGLLASKAFKWGTAGVVTSVIIIAFGGYIAGVNLIPRKITETPIS